MERVEPYYHMLYHLSLKFELVEGINLIIIITVTECVRDFGIFTDVYKLV